MEVAVDIASPASSTRTYDSRIGVLAQCPESSQQPKTPLFVSSVKLCAVSFGPYALSNRQRPEPINSAEITVKAQGAWKSSVPWRRALVHARAALQWSSQKWPFCCCSVSGGDPLEKIVKSVNGSSISFDDRASGPWSVRVCHIAHSICVAQHTAIISDGTRSPTMKMIATKSLAIAM